VASVTIERVSEIVGRQEELASLRGFVDAARSPAALVLEGEAGVGKSTLWLAAVEHARARGLRVLSSRPAEAESALAHVGLADLFDDVVDEVLPALTPPRRRALEVALLLEEAKEPVEAGALGLAVRDALQSLTDEGPLLVAIDDLQWLDPASEQALSFAARRLDARPLLLLLARRPGDRRQASALERALVADAVRRLHVGPLSVGALHRFLRDRLDRPFARQTLLHVHERSGGNPFLALELARVLEADAAPTHAFTVPATVEELLRARLTELPAHTHEALGLASAVGTTSEALLAKAGVARDALDPAVDAQVIERDAGTVRFTHPLLATVVYQGLGEERRRVHRRLAEVVDDPLLHARHLALSRDVPDAGVAAVLDEAAALAARRGAAAVSAELAEEAVRLTPQDEPGERHRRSLAAARAHRAAGEWTRAKSIATRLLADTPRGGLRADALVLLAELEGVERAVGLLGEALSLTSSPALRASIHLRLAWVSRFREDWYAQALDHARAAAALADELDDDVLRGRVEVVRAVIGWIAGDPDAPQLAERAYEFASAVGGEQLVQEAASAFVNSLVWTHRSDEARAFLEHEHERSREVDEPRSARALWSLAWVEFWTGRWALAADYAAQAHEIRVQYGLEVPQDHLPIAIVAAHRGRIELAREHSERALALAEEQLGLHPPQHLAILGLVALGSGDLAEAEARLGGADRQAALLGWGEPSIRWWSADYVELLLELGRPDEASRILDAWESDAVRLGRERVLAHVIRCRGLVAAAGGEVEQALELLADAVARHEAVGDPFGCARALLALGVARRRARQKRLAREAIEAAIGAFETIGAAGWADRARGELGRIGGRRPAGEELTPTERRVAELVAEGRTNKEIAAALYVTPKTVGTTLSRLYAKVHVRSRTELIRHLAERPPSKV
jgi:DNA-binding CsgD family transcriptional regulator